VFAAPLMAIQLFQFYGRELLFMKKLAFPLELKSACYAGLMYLVVFHAAAPQAFIYFQF